MLRAAGRPSAKTITATTAMSKLFYGAGDRGVLVYRFAMHTQRSCDAARLPISTSRTSPFLRTRHHDFCSRASSRMD